MDSLIDWLIDYLPYLWSGTVLFAVRRSVLHLCPPQVLVHWSSSPSGRLEVCEHNNPGHRGTLGVESRTCIVCSTVREEETTTSPSCSTDLAPEDWSKPSAQLSSFSTRHRLKDQLFSKALTERAEVEVQCHSILISILVMLGWARRDHRKFSISYILSEAVSASLVVSRCSSLSEFVCVWSSPWNRTWGYHSHTHILTHTHKGTP